MDSFSNAKSWIDFIWGLVILTSGPWVTAGEFQICDLDRDALETPGVAWYAQYMTISSFCLLFDPIKPKLAGRGDAHP